MSFRKQLFFLSLLLIFSPENIFAQLKSANKYFDNNKYEKAIPLYLEYLAKNTDQQALKNLAECYRLTSNYPQAEIYYEKLIKAPNPEPLFYFYYGMALKNNKKTDEAREQFERYLKLAGDDKAGAEFQMKSCEEIKNITKHLPQYELTNVKELNTEGSEFGAAYYKNGIVFAAERNKDLVTFDKNNATGRPYLDLYFSEVKKEKRLGDVSNVNPGNDVSINNNASVTLKHLKPVYFSSRINSKYDEGPACFSADGKTIYFSKVELINLENKDFVNVCRIYTSTDNNGNWSKPAAVSFSSDKYSVMHPSLSADGMSLYFASDMPGGSGGLDLYVSKKENNGWGAPVNLGNKINTKGNEEFPFIRSDGKLFFSSNGHPGMGGLDIFSATMQSTNTWGNIENAGGVINSSQDDFAICFAGDNESGYVSSNRPGGAGNDDLYSFKVLNKLISISGKILLSEKVSDPAKGLKILLLAEDGNVLSVTTTDNTGYFMFKGIRPEQKYMVKVDENDPEFVYSKHFYLADEKNHLIRKAVVNDRGGIFVFQNLPADPNEMSGAENVDDPKLYLAGNLLTGDVPAKPLSNYKIKLLNEKGEVISTLYTNALGGFVFSNLPHDQKYMLKLDEKDPSLNANTKIIITNRNGKEIMRASGGIDGVYHFDLLPSDKNTMELMTVTDTELRIDMKGRLVGADKKTPLAHTKIHLLNNRGEVVKIILTDSEGRFAFMSLPADESFIVSVDETDPKLANLTKLHILDEKGNVIREIDKDIHGKFHYRKLPVAYSNEMTEAYVDDPWLKALQLKTNTSGKKDSLVIIESIYYNLGESNILPEAQKTLDKVVQVMKSDPTIKIELSSHTDSRASDEYNMQLSELRAKKAVEYVISRGISNKRITGKGYGETRLMNHCANGVDCTEEEHSKNRRTEFKITR